jgi:hypothetical protein
VENYNSSGNVMNSVKGKYNWRKGKLSFEFFKLENHGILKNWYLLHLLVFIYLPFMPYSLPSESHL